MTQTPRPNPARRGAIAILLALCAASGAAQTAPPAPPEAAETAASPEDQALARRVQAAFDRIADLSAVAVEVGDGVATLEGTVPRLEDRAKAEELASRFKGIIYVDNGIELTSDVQTRISPAAERLREYGQQLIANLPTIGIALALLMIFAFAASVIAKWEGPFQRLGISPLVAGLLRRLTAAAVLVIGALLSFDILGVTALVGAVLGTAGIIGIAIGFAFQNIIESYLAGILLSTRRLFAVNDIVGIGEYQGKIIRLTASDLVLMTFDGNHLRLPNAEVFKSPVTNYTRNPMRRLTFGLGVGVQENLTSVLRIGHDTLKGMEGISPDPEPIAHIEEFGDSSMLIRFYAWVDQRTVDLIKARSEAIRLVKAAFDEAGIEMPEPTQRVLVTQAAGERETGTAGAAAKLQVKEQPTVVDVSVDDQLDKQIREDLATSKEQNLLE